MNIPAQQEPSAANLRALVVDDCATVRRLMDLTLRPMGIEVEFADNGEDALALVKGAGYDIVFLDVLLPGIDGYRVCKAIKGDKRMKDTPVIMLTSRDSAFDKVRGIMSGTDVYLIKPLERVELLRAMKKCLSQGRAIAWARAMA